MAGLAVAAGLAATALAPTAPAAAAPGDPLRVLHWNIAGMTINPFEPDKPDNQGAMEVVDRLLEFADARTPHLVSMNETCSAQADHAREGLAERFGSAQLHFAPADGVDVLCTTGGLGAPRSGSAVIAVGADAVTDPVSYYLNDDGTITSEPRERQAACLTADFGSTLGRTVRACALHLDTDDQIAAVQAEGFADFMTEDGTDHPLVLMGDFNASPEFFPGVYVPVQGGDGLFLEADHPADRHTFYAGEKLDYVFADQEHFGPGLSAEVIDRTTCFAGLIDHPCSDHDALFGVLPFRDADAPPDDGGAPTVSAGPDVSGDEGTPIPLAGTVGDDSQATTATWSAEVTSAEPGASCSFTRPNSPRTSVICTDDGTYTVTLTADDGVHPPVSDSAVVTVRNAPPVLTLTGPTPWQLFRADAPVSLTASFTDAANDTHTCTVDWDDTAAPEEYAGTGGSCDRTHVFPDAGMYTIRVTVTDDDGASASAEVMVVVYDPDAGAANADGSVTTPPGAYVPNPGRTGDEWFHLTARYYGSTATVPTGQVKTWLADGAPNFRFDSGSSGLEWLVVTPDGKIAAKGQGHVDFETETFGIVLYGYDGCADGAVTPRCRPGPDRVRVVVWPLSAGDHPGEEIRYDNRLGAGYDVDVADPQPLLSGQVLVQR
ncbi:PKD domain-containing protein [Cellulomonas shaoxiangyii]|uniref:PKD domain-containing protein n=1 Tax=Cellulomonas shaoxiangyii TaxID=2566013 RepID=A0A4P7SPA6_9CELL|nr:PKD domain-containing protein [Cellulomonas shaoxiangyii]QCB94804.1 hypothetical protein E5225_15785 [Cellulomonas shaoxiangyii]TGY86534.1 hypothetical protein E5226_01810 [Cellulomonas shaoxiangyii]